MVRRDLEKYLGKKVQVTLYDKSTQTGVLHKTGEESYKNNYNLYLPKNFYFIEPERECLFRTSSVVKIKEVM